MRGKKRAWSTQRGGLNLENGDTMFFRNTDTYRITKGRYYIKDYNENCATLAEL
jgi:hypothetical protein